MSGTRLSLALLLAISSLAAQARDYAYSDAHLHYVDFFQESAGMDKLLKAMADNRIEHVMISGIPVAKKWHEDEPKRPRYYAGDDADAYWYSATDVIVAAAVNKLSPAQRQHFHPFLAGFNPNDKNSAAHIQRMLDLNPGLWQGIGEVFTRHDDLTALTSGDTPRANNEAMTRIYHLAAENDLPVMLHSNITSKRERNPLYLAEVEQPLRNHPHTRFIWAHAGTSKEIHRHQVQMEFCCPPWRACLRLTPTCISTCPGACSHRICWTTPASHGRNGLRWWSASRIASCSAPMLWGASISWARRCAVSILSSMRCPKTLPTRLRATTSSPSCPSRIAMATRVDIAF